MVENVKDCQPFMLTSSACGCVLTTRRTILAGHGFDVGDRQLQLVAGSTPECANQHFVMSFSGIPDVVLLLHASGFEITCPVTWMSDLQAYVTGPAGTR